MAQAAKTMGFAGWSGSGKTSLLIKLIPELTRRGIAVSTIKHAHHSFEIDRPGKDSHRHRVAGASEVLVSSANRWALIHEGRGAPELGLDELLVHLAPVDLVLVEGFKASAHAKLEVHRGANGKPLLHLDDPKIFAIASDVALADAAIPVLDLDDTGAIADFLVAHFDLAVRQQVRAGGA